MCEFLAFLAILGSQVPAPPPPPPWPMVSVPSRYGSNHGAQTGGTFMGVDTDISTFNLRIFFLFETIGEFRLKQLVGFRRIKVMEGAT